MVDPWKPGQSLVLHLQMGKLKQRRAVLDHASWCRQGRWGRLREEEVVLARGGVRREGGRGQWPEGSLPREGFPLQPASGQPPENRVCQLQPSAWGLEEGSRQLWGGCPGAHPPSQSLAKAVLLWEHFVILGPFGVSGEQL